MQVKGSDGAIERGAEHDFVCGAEDDGRDGRGVFGESHEAEPSTRVPQLHLPVREREREVNGVGLDNRVGTCLESKQVHK